MKVKVHVFANLKDYFESNINMEVPENATLDNVVQNMITLNPKSEALLSICRIAINDTFVNSVHLLKDDEEVFFIPPSSGG